MAMCFGPKSGIDYSFFSWLVQQLSALIVPAVWALITADIPVSLRAGLPYPLGNIAEVVWYVFLVWGSGSIDRVVLGGPSARSLAYLARSLGIQLLRAHATDGATNTMIRETRDTAPPGALLRSRRCAYGCRSFPPCDVLFRSLYFLDALAFDRFYHGRGRAGVLRVRDGQCAPSAARRLAIAAPKPREPSVTRVIFPPSFLNIVFLNSFNHALRRSSLVCRASS